jgi:hypothetical protein
MSRAHASEHDVTVPGVISVSGPAPGGAWGRAVFSDDGAYRYRLSRQWGQPYRPLVFVMLNPSTADERTDDATITRCRKIAGRESMTGIVVVNLYAMIATDPDRLLSAPDPVGIHNDEFIADAVSALGGKVVLAWGAAATRPKHRDRVQDVLDIVEASGNAWWSLGRTRSGHPPHPGRLPAATPLIAGVRPFSHRREHAAH